MTNPEAKPHSVPETLELLLKLETTITDSPELSDEIRLVILNQKLLAHMVGTVGVLIGQLHLRIGK